MALLYVPVATRILPAMYAAGRNAITYPPARAWKEKLDIAAVALEQRQISIPHL